MSTTTESSNYAAVYSRESNLLNRISPEPDQEAREHLDDIMEDIDWLIDATIRANLGDKDKNGYRILLPLSGDYNVINQEKKTVTLKMEKAIQKIADDMVIAEYRRDASESSERREVAEKDLQKTIERIYGVVISSVLPDFTTEQLAADTVISTNSDLIVAQNSDDVIEINP